MKTLELKLDDGKTVKPLFFRVERMVNAGYVGRDMAAVQAHIEELAHEGVPKPTEIPMIFPVSVRNLTTDERIEVVGNRTSGEVEYVLLMAADRIYIGVGSDHTDRQVEASSIVKSKQICPNILSSTVWDYASVRDRWDELMLQSWVKPFGADREVLYQSAPCGTIIEPGAILDRIRTKMTDRRTDGLVVFSGTVPVVTANMIYGEHFRCELRDPLAGRSLSCGYRVEPLEYLGDIDG
jgi:hypothetical protein